MNPVKDANDLIVDAIFKGNSFYTGDPWKRVRLKTLIKNALNDKDAAWELIAAESRGQDEENFLQIRGLKEELKMASEVVQNRDAEIERLRNSVPGSVKSYIAQVEHQQKQLESLRAAAKVHLEVNDFNSAQVLRELLAEVKHDSNLS